MRTLSLLMVLIFALVFVSEAQQERGRKNNSATTQSVEPAFEELEMKLQDPSINEGSGGYSYPYYYGDPCGMYLNKEWIKGEAIQVNGNSIEGEFRYNICIQKMEAIVEGDTFAFAKPEELGDLYIGSRKFVYLPYHRSNGELCMSWFEELVDGKCELLLRRFIKYRETEGDADHSNDKLYRLEEYYFRRNDNIMEGMYASKSSIMKVMSDHKENMRLYIKSEKLKYNRQTDLIKMFTFYNNLH